MEFELYYPNIEHDGKKYFEVGCRKCTLGGNWKMFSDGKQFIAQCENCGHITNLPPTAVKLKPDCDSPGKEE